MVVAGADELLTGADDELEPESSTAEPGDGSRPGNKPMYCRTLMSTCLTCSHHVMCVSEARAAATEASAGTGTTAKAASATSNRTNVVRILRMERVDYTIRMGLVEDYG